MAIMPAESNFSRERKMTRKETQSKQEKSQAEKIMEDFKIPVLDENGIAIFHCLSGYELKYVPISLLDIARVREGTERKYREAGEMVDPPKLKIPVAGGNGASIDQIVNGEIVQELKRQFEDGSIDPTIKDAAEKSIQEFEIYNETLGRLFVETNDNTTRVYMRAIINFPPMDDQAAWIKERVKMGIMDIPAIGKDGDLFERQRYWLLNDALRLPTELLKLQGAITFVSSEGAMNWEDVGAAASLFRDSIRNIVAGPDQADSAGNQES